MPAVGLVVVMAFLALLYANAIRRAREIADEAEALGENRRTYFWRAFNGRNTDEIRETLELKRQLQATQKIAREDRRRLRGLDGVGPAKPIAPAALRTPAERMKDLQDLYRQGLINEEEFSAKRRDILGEV